VTEGQIFDSKGEFSLCCNEEAEVDGCILSSSGSHVYVKKMRNDSNELNYRCIMSDDKAKKCEYFRQGKLRSTRDGPKWICTIARDHTCDDIEDVAGRLKTLYKNLGSQGRSKSKTNYEYNHLVPLVETALIEIMTGKRGNTTTKKALLSGLTPALKAILCEYTLVAPDAKFVQHIREIAIDQFVGKEAEYAVCACLHAFLFCFDQVPICLKKALYCLNGVYCCPIQVST